MQPQGIELTKAIMDTAASSARSKTQASLFMAHLSQAQSLISDRQTEAAASREKRGAEDEAGNREKAKSFRHHTAGARGPDKAASQSADSPASLTAAEALPLPDIAALAPVSASTGNAPKTAGADSANPDETGSDGATGALHKATPATGAAAMTDQAVQTMLESGVPADPNRPGGGPTANPSQTGAQTLQQAAGADSQKPIAFVRAVGTATTGAAANKAADDALSQAPGQVENGAAPSIKVVVQPNPQSVAAPVAPGGAHLAQEEAAAAPPTNTGVLPAPSPNQPQQASGSQGLIAVAAAGGSPEGNHNQAFDTDGDGKSDLLKDGTLSASATPSSAGASGGGASFASLVSTSAGTVPMLAQPASTTPSGTSSPSAQVPLPPIEQMITGFSKLSDGANSFSMQLDPERLGSVSIRLEVDSKGKAKATFSAEHPETLALLRQDSGQLVKALQQAGVNADASSLSFSLKDQGGGGNASQERRFPSNTGTNAQNAATGAINPAGSQTEAHASASSRLYDLRA